MRSCSDTKSCKGFHCAMFISSYWPTDCPTNFSLSSRVPARQRRTEVHRTLFLRRDRRGFCFKIHRITTGRRLNGLTRQNLSTQKFYRQWILYQRLYRALEGTGAIIWIVTFAGEQLSPRIVEHQLDASFCKHGPQPLQLHVNDFCYLLARKLMED